MELVFFQVRVRRRREFYVADELDPREIDLWLFQETQKRQFRSWQTQGGGAPETTGHYNTHIRQALMKQGTEARNSLIDRDRVNALSHQRFNSAKAFPHTHSSPCGPLETQTPAGGVFLLEANREIGQPVICHSVIRLTLHSCACDHGPEGDEQAKFVRGDSGEHLLQPFNFGCQRLTELLFGQSAQEPGGIGPRSM